jgi:hypothetical protein
MYEISFRYKPERIPVIAGFETWNGTDLSTCYGEVFHTKTVGNALKHEM